MSNVPIEIACLGCIIIMAYLSPLSNRLLEQFHDKLVDAEKNLPQGEILFVLRRKAGRVSIETHRSNLDNLNSRLKDIYKKYVLVVNWLMKSRLEAMLFRIK